jgi:hypothetical protein
MEGQTSGWTRVPSVVRSAGQQDDQQDGASDQAVSVPSTQSVITASQLEYLSVSSLRRQLRDPDKHTVLTF